ncbi:Left-right determination factor 2 [Varanus komodoensis]|uniref:left-right determination factor 2-like n=1 Tax=Varanus komodoensis TaxID=61221 RepID=UPI001CF7918A|nr:left-right determination factor 2-like [Varanus komodoensis]KAF7254686.1 Left-right determination factor 2 [Varanus komodoensis]
MAMSFSWAWLLTCALFIATTASGFTQKGLRQMLLEKLGLPDVPVFQRTDLENLVIPQNIRNKYISILKHRRVKRRTLPSLAGILRGIPGNADISGDILYSDTTRQNLIFDMEGRIPENSEVTMAELKLFKKPLERKHLPSRPSQRPVLNARVSVYLVQHQENGTNRTSLIDSRLVPIMESGWKNFDVTQAVHFWLKAKKPGPILLEIWIEGERLGNYASEMAKSVRFTSQDPSDKALGKPELVLYTLNLEEYGGPGDCKEGLSTEKAICCRQEHYINFRELTWTQYWIIEPAGYQAYRCVGGCRQPKNLPHHFGYGERTCAVVESSPLPMMYLVKKGNYTEIEVAEFPNMIVEKCGCVMDNIAVV